MSGGLWVPSLCGDTWIVTQGGCFPCPQAHTQTVTHRQAAHTSLLQEVAVQPNPFCLHKLCPRTWAKHLKKCRIKMHFLRSGGVFFLRFAPKATPESSVGSGSGGCWHSSSHTPILTPHQVTEVLPKHIRHKVPVPQAPAWGQFSP